MEVHHSIIVDGGLCRRESRTVRGAVIGSINVRNGRGVRGGKRSFKDEYSGQNNNISHFLHY